MLFSSSFIHILAPFLPISTIYRRQSFHCSVNLPCNTTPHSRYVYNRSRYCILNWAWATCVLRNEPPIVVALDLVATPRVQKALDRCLSQTTRVKILCLNTKAWNLTCWENDPLQSKPKSAEQTKSSIRKIRSPQITVYIFWGFPNGNHLFSDRNFRFSHENVLPSPIMQCNLPVIYRSTKTDHLQSHNLQYGWSRGVVFDLNIGFSAIFQHF